MSINGIATKHNCPIYAYSILPCIDHKTAIIIHMVAACFLLLEQNNPFDEKYINTIIDNSRSMMVFSPNVHTARAEDNKQ